jgi:6-phosphogluconolactonase (cycloisomerase 2 family)
MKHRSGVVPLQGFQRGFALLSLGAMAMLTGCGEFFTPVNNNPGGTGSTSFVYVTNEGSGGAGGTLSAYSMTSGVLTQLSGSPYTLPATPTSIVVAPNNAFLYVGTNLGVFLYTIATDGTLTEGNDDTIVYQGPTQSQSLAVDSTNSWLVIANQNSTELDALAIDPSTGVPPSVTPVSFTLSAASPLQIAFSAANTNLFAALGTNGAEAIGFSAGSAHPFGTAVKIGLYGKGGTVNAVASDPTSAYLYLAEGTSNELRTFTIANLSAKEVDYQTGNGPSSILADPTGAYVYVANNTDNTISAFTVSAGVLTAQADSPFSTAKAPVELAEDSTRSHVLSIGFGTNPNLWVYSFDSTTAGTLDVGATTSTASTDPALSNAIALTH